MVAADVPDFVVSAALVAAICTVGIAGKSIGAVYRPSVEMVPTDGSPPAMSLTLQITLASLAFVTVAVNICVFPRMIAVVDGVTVTVTDPDVAGGGGFGVVGVVGVTKPAPVAAQPHNHAAIVRRIANRKTSTSTDCDGVIVEISRLSCGKGGMLFLKASESPAKV